MLIIGKKVLDQKLPCLYNPLSKLTQLACANNFFFSILENYFHLRSPQTISLLDFAHIIEVVEFHITGDGAEHRKFKSRFKRH